MVEQPDPDTKDWTWVLERACPECGFDTTLPEREDLAPLASYLAVRWSGVLSTHPDPRTRPEPKVWSPLEYGCHVRDVFDLATMRLGLMRAEDGVRFANWDPDPTAIESDYAGQDPVEVAAAIAVAGQGFADAVAAVGDDEWSHRGLRGDDAEFTIETFTRYLLHDPAHHLTDVTGERFSSS